VQIAEIEHLTYGGLLFMGKNAAINQSVSESKLKNICTVKKNVIPLRREKYQNPRFL